MFDFLIPNWGIRRSKGKHHCRPQKEKKYKKDIKDNKEQKEEVVIMTKKDEEKVIINVSKEISFGDSELDECSNGQH